MASVPFSLGSAGPERGAESMSLAVKEEQLIKGKERRRSERGEASHRRRGWGGSIVDGRDDDNGGSGEGNDLIDQIIGHATNTSRSHYTAIDRGFI